MLRKNALIAYSAETVNLLASFVFVGYFIRTFSAAIYGDFIVLTSFIAFLTMYNFGADSALKAEYGNNLGAADRVVILIRTLFVLCIFLITSTIVVVLLFVFRSFSVLDTTVVQLAATFDFYIYGSIFLVLFAVIQAHILLTSSFLVERAYNTSISLASLIATILVALFDLDFLYFLSFRLFLLVCLGLLLLKFYAYGHLTGVREALVSAHSPFALSKISYTLRSSLKYMSLGASSLVIWSIDPIIIRSFLSGHDVGTYSLIFRLITLGLVLPTAICTAITPYLSKYSAENDSQKLKSLYQSTVHTILIIFLPFAFIVLFFSDLIVSSWIGQEFSTSSTLRLTLLAWVALMFINSINTLIIVLTGSANFILVLVLLTEALLHIVLSLLLVNKFQLEGVAFSALISFALTTLPYQFYIIFKRFKLSGGNQLFHDIFFTAFLYVSSIMSAFCIFYFYKSLLICSVMFICLGFYFLIRYYKQGHLGRLIGLI